jgi:hypothetical protein
LNCCDSDGPFRESKRRFFECGSPIELLTVEYPVFNFYDHKRVLNLLQNMLTFADWKTIKSHYDSEIYKRRNRLIVDSAYKSSGKRVKK